MYSYILHSLFLSKPHGSSSSVQVHGNQMLALGGNVGPSDCLGNRSSVSSEGFCENEQEPDNIIVHSSHSLEQEETDSQGGGNYDFVLLSHMCYCLATDICT